MTLHWKSAWWVGWLLALSFTLVCFHFLGKLAAPMWASSKGSEALAATTEVQRVGAPKDRSVVPLQANGKATAKVVPNVTINNCPCSEPTKAVSATVANDTADTNQAIANTMTAVSAAIAAITLVITLGATWIAKKSEEILEYRRLVEQDSASVKRLHDDMIDARNIQLELLASLLATKDALRHRVQSVTRGVSAWGDYINLATHLEQLMSTNAEARMTAFGILLMYLQDTNDADLNRRLAVYTRKCHEWLQLSDALPADGEASWCLLFSPEEQQAWVEAKTARERSHGGEFV